MRHSLLRQTVQAVFLPITRKAETLSHPENPRSSSNPQAKSDLNTLKWENMEYNASVFYDQMLSSIFHTHEVRLAITITSVSVACIISFLKPLWYAWEAWNRSLVAAFSWVDARGDVPDMGGADKAFWPWMKLLQSVGYNRYWKRLILFSPHRRKLF